MSRDRPRVPLVDNEVWADIYKTWKRDPKVFTHGCGQATVAYAVYAETGHRYPPRTVRRVLLAAVRQEAARYCRPPHDARSSSRAFHVEIVSRWPLADSNRALRQYRFRLLAARPMRNSRAKKVLERVILAESDYTAFTKCVRPGEILLSVECHAAS